MVALVIVRLLNVAAGIKSQGYHGSVTREERTVNHLIKIVFAGSFIQIA